MKNREGKSKAFYQLLIEAGYKSNLSDSLLDFYQEKQGLFFNLIAESLNLEAITDDFPDEVKQVYLCYKLNKEFSLNIQDSVFSKAMREAIEIISIRKNVFAPIDRNKRRILVIHLEKLKNSHYYSFIHNNIGSNKKQEYVLNKSAIEYLYNDYDLARTLF